jgi:UTP--glucose-1-phosphate uridylyltransferase
MLTHPIVRKAIFPIAGLGTRFLPATKASPKEMLTVVDKPLIQYAVEEAYAAGIRQMIFVTGRTKRAVEDHFDTAYELETELEMSCKYDLLSQVRAIKPNDMECFYVRQSRALGLGHAVLCAKNLIGEEPFAVLLADDLMVGQPPILTQMLNQFSHLQTSIVAVQTVPDKDTQRYGIVAGNKFKDNLVDIQQIIEKPIQGSAPSNLGVVGRYILTPEIFNELLQQNSGVGDEIQLTDGIAALLQKQKVFAYKFQGTRYDCGSKFGFLQASVELGERHKEFGQEFSSWLAMRQKTSVWIAPRITSYS